MKLTNDSYLILLGTRNFTERYYRDKKGWLKVSSRGRKFRMTAEQLLNHLLPAVAGVKPGLTFKVKHRDAGPMKRKARTARANKPKSHDDYLARLSPDKRAALQKLRKAIRAAAPKAVECISYQIPAFRLNGKFLVAYGAGANHCAFYPGSVVRDLGVAIKGYDVGKGTIRFASDKPLPASLVGKLIKRRISQDR